MKTIRHNTFETNSSSTHSITIDRVNYPNKQIPKTLTLEGSKFGWEFERFNDFLRKASYFWTLGEYCQDVQDRMLRLSETHGFDLVWPERDKHGYVDVYIDHGSEHYDQWIADYPELETDEGLWDFLTSEACWIMLGNDNSCDPPNWRESPKSSEVMPYTISLIACDPKDHISSFDFSIKVQTPNLKDHEHKIYNLVENLLESERKSYTDPYTKLDEMTDEGVIKIEYYRYDHTTSKRNVVRTRHIRAVSFNL